MRLIFILFVLSNFISFKNGQAISSSADLSALYSLRASLSLRSRDWPRDAEPCSRWTGVGCDAAGRVISLNLHGLTRTRLGRKKPRFAVDGLKNLTFLTSFNATGFSLPGPIPAWFGSLNPNLAVVDLSHASVSGGVPSSLGNLSSLVLLDLSSNLLIGSLPDGLQNLQSLKNLNFGRNSLTGSIKKEFFSTLLKLESVTLTRNNFSGFLPGSIFSSPELKFLDVSYNNFTGNLSDLSAANSSHNGIELDLSHNLLYGSLSSEFSSLISRFNFVDISSNYFQGSLPFNTNSRNLSFASNCFMNDSTQRSTSECEQFYNKRGMTYDGTVNSNSENKWKYIVIAVVCGTAFFIFIIISIVIFIMKCRVHSAEQNSNLNTVAQPYQSSMKSPTTGEAFTYDQLALATMNFSEENLIKQGHSGDIFHGVLEDGTLAVVKRIDSNSERKEDYLAELDLFGRSSHERLITLLGHCLENENEKFLVYKEMPHRDLSYALYCGKGELGESELQSLDWITRWKIAIGVAEAVCHLHYDFTPPLVHRDIQASSILLDDKFEVRLGSLSSVCAQEGDGHQNAISKLFRFSQSSSSSEQPATICSSTSSAYDVQCFGKVLLELVTGKLGISASNNASTTEFLDRTLRYIDINEKDLMREIIDPSLIIYDDLLEEIWAVSIVARSCLNPKPSKRPGMKYVRRALESPLKVVREESYSDSIGLGEGESWRSSSWNVAALFGSRRNERSLREFSFSRGRAPKEVVPEPDSMDGLA